MPSKKSNAQTTAVNEARNEDTADLNETVAEGEQEIDARFRDSRRLTRRRVRHRSSAYRQLAKRSGLTEEGESYITIGDSLHCVLSTSDAKRLSTFVPATPSSTSFDCVEFKERLRLFEEGVPEGAIAETQGNCDALLRWIITSCLMKNADVNGRRNMITAHDIYQFLRPMVGKTLFTSIVAPPGLKQSAQEQGVLAAGSEDKGDKQHARKRNLENKKAWAEMEARKEAVKKARAIKRAAVVEAKRTASSTPAPETA